MDALGGELGEVFGIAAGRKMAAAGTGILDLESGEHHVLRRVDADDKQVHPAGVVPARPLRPYRAARAGIAAAAMATMAVTAIKGAAIGSASTTGAGSRPFRKRKPRLA